MSMEVEQLKVILQSESIVEETEASNWYKNIRKVLGALAGQARRVFIKYWCPERTEEDKTLIHLQCSHCPDRAPITVWPRVLWTNESKAAGDLLVWPARPVSRSANHRPGSQPQRANW